MTDAAVKHRSTLELFLIRGKLVASQASYVIFQKETTYEVKHYYCPSCGIVWGQRVVPDSLPSFHHYYSSTCKSCGGTDDMLCPFEHQNLEVLGPSVLAHLLLEETKGWKDETAIT